MSHLQPAFGAPRRGMTLLEVIVAMAIFLMALGAVVPLIQMGQSRALEVQLQAFAMQKCQAKMAEVMSGETLPSSQTDVAYDDPSHLEDGWHWSMTADTTDVENLWNVKVSVYRQLEGSKIEVSLIQQVLDPIIRGGPSLTPLPPPDPSGGGGRT